MFNCFAQRKINKTLIKKTIAMFLLGYFIVSLLVMFTPVANWLSNFFYVKPEIQKADAVVILSASSYSDGTLSLFSLERVVRGVSLYKQGLVETVVFVGNSGINKDPDAATMKKVAVEMGIPEAKVLVGCNSTNTYYNFMEAKEIMEKNNIQTALLVTSSTHLKRSMMIVGKLKLNVYPASLSVDQYRQVSVDRLTLFWAELKEMIALSYYKLKGWI